MRISDWSSDVCSSDLLVPARLQRLDRLFREAAFKAEMAGLGRPRIEGAREMLAMPGRRIDGFLQVHAVMHDLEEQLWRPLVLLVATRRYERHGRLAKIGRATCRERVCQYV